jgi:hypothetical protein
MDACTGQSDVHTQPFAFRQPEEDDESVKISNTTSGRSSALSAALPASRPLQNRQFLFNTNKPFSHTTNFCNLHKTQHFIFFYSIQMSGHQSLLTNHQFGQRAHFTR